MRIFIGVSEQTIQKINNLQNTFFFWDKLPTALYKYADAVRCFFENDEIEIYLCCGNTIAITAKISAIYNIHNDDKTSCESKENASRQEYLKTVYRLWCNNNSVAYDDKWSDNSEFQSYLQETGFFLHNYGILLRDIQAYTEKKDQRA